ncbi:MAG TPA: tetratricopeptide repeat protein, partial [Longimicrobium sp.]|nr:tetratricopeptide repeat protein [Longimicrobium sp.]
LTGRMGRAAEEAFFWAARLEPSRAEPLYAQRVAIFAQDIRRWERYLAQDAATLRDPAILRADALMAQALLRSPFVPRGLDLLLYNELPGSWSSDPLTQGWLMYARGEHEAAARALSRALVADPSSQGRRMDLALVLVGLGRMDSAAVHVQAVLDAVRRREETEVVRVYESKEMLEYSLGLLHLARGRLDEARAAMERAALENAGAAYIAHRGLGLVARARGDVEALATETGRAAELAGENPLLIYEHGRALVDAGRPAEAIPLLTRAAAQEPHWADAHLHLGRAHDAAGDIPAALAAYARLLELAPRRASALSDAVRQRMAELQPSPAPAPPAPGR